MIWTEEALAKCIEKVKKNIDRIGQSYPHVAKDLKYNDQGKFFWTSGFWSGILWLYYNETADRKAKELAEKLEEGMDEVLDGFITLHHDLGFMWKPSAVTNYKLTGNEISRIRGLKAASHLAGRFNLAGKFIRAWSDDVHMDSQGWAIIDCLMNLSLLFWASKEMNDPRFRHIAIAHADTVVKEFIRADNTTPHIVCFDPNTGEKLSCRGGQGKDGESAWSRGQAWAIYGMAIAYREIGKKEYLDNAKNVAAYFISHLPKDKVPYWDFRSDKKDRYALDSSAAACAASGLLEISKLVNKEIEREYYRNQALMILKSLYENYFDKREESEVMLKKGTVSYPAGKNVNVGIIYGDMFFMEALIKLDKNISIF